MAISTTVQLGSQSGIGFRHDGMAFPAPWTRAMTFWNPGDGSFFSILVSNLDDHLKNHAFIYAGRGRWRLSPAYDVNPAPTRQRMLQTGIMEGESFEVSLTLALEAASFFDVEAGDAKPAAARMAAIISSGWREALRAEGASVGDVEAFAVAFVHEAMEQALSLT